MLHATVRAVPGPRHRIAIFGANGYAGMELQALLAHHPHVEVALATSEHLTGAALAERVAGCAVALLAVPAEAARGLASTLHAQGVRVIDLSPAFRFDWVYGLPELSRAGIAEAARVANPGCYVTAATLALAPLLAAGAIARDDLVVDAMSGVTGAGRKLDEGYSFVDLHANARAYRVLAHAHEREIARNLSRGAGGDVDVTFTAHLVPLARGILATCYARPTAATTAADLAALLEDRYRGEPFVRIADSADDVAIAHVAGTNACELGVAASGRRVVVTAAIDNLVKGAAGQAIQAANLRLGFAETAGLEQAGLYPL
jgi:N-acetyl-gamma-glutamyl-phosphate reductase